MHSLNLPLLLTCFLIVFAFGGLCGLWVGNLRSGARVNERLIRAETTAELLTQRTSDLEADAQIAGELTAAVGPLNTELRNLSQAVSAQDKQRVAQLSSLETRLQQLHLHNEQLQTTTGGLLTALTSHTTRGNWGEVHLRRVVELSGLVEHVDFATQKSGTSTAGNTVRPDLVIHLPGEGTIVLDAKVPLNTLNAEQDASKQAAALRKHVQQLAGKAYWSAFNPAPRFVVCFIPTDGLLAAAAAAAPTLVEEALSRNVILASPSTLLALLRTVVLNWQHHQLSRNAQHVLDAGRELYNRLGVLTGHLSSLGKGINRTVDDYNSLVGSFDSRFVPCARKLAAAGLGDQEFEVTTQVLGRARSHQNEGDSPQLI